MASTGLPGLDEVLQGLWPGDNVVWMVEDAADYVPMLAPFCKEAYRSQTPLVYFRFARHAALLTPESGAEVHTIDPNDGFEHFVTRILDVIEQTGKGGLFVFDCLSDLAADWFSDRMLGNFFMIVCPYLYKLDAVAYFALLKHHHSVHAIEPINQTAQVILEVFHKGEGFYVQPLRVWKRRSPTMYMLHSWDDDSFAPVTSSSTIAEVLTAAPKRWLEFTHRRVGPWARRFQKAQDMVEDLRAGRPVDDAARKQVFDQLIRMVLTRDPRFERLAARYFDLPALVEIVGRMIGTGMVGGKALGMLLSRAILSSSGPQWSELLEDHDSFYIGSDVFYTYLVQNDCWWLRRLDEDFDVYLQRAAEVRQRILRGSFPQYIEDQFTELLGYFGQSPLIVRSSSLLEDSYGNSFSGKYESVFLANQGAPEERLKAFLDAVRAVYASTMSEASLTYRHYRNVLDRDEQMALLVQRVSGEMQDDLFFPHAAGVGFSFNPFVWREDIDPRAGVLRLVFGLGTRASNPRAPAKGNASSLSAGWTCSTWRPIDQPLATSVR
jgi:pyruvate,water dikinase